MMKRPAAKRERSESACPSGPSGSAGSSASDTSRPHPSEDQTPLKKKNAVEWSALWYCSDCSGLDAGAIAIKRVSGGDARHWFGSEIHRPYKEIFSLIHPECEHCFDDVSKRSCDELAAERRANPNALVVYSAGFPCQPYSRDGSQGGADDPRSAVMYDVLMTVEKIRPTIFLLENVKDLAMNQRFRAVWSDLMYILVHIGGGAYYIDWQVLDSIDYSVPASRPRVYVVGVLKNDLCSAWAWPKPTPCAALSSALVLRKKSEKIAGIIEQHSADEFGEGIGQDP